MSIDSYNPHNRYRDRSARRFVAVLKFLAVLLISALFGFWMGKQYAVEHYLVVKNNLKDMQREQSVLQEQVMDLTAQAQTAQVRYKELQEQVADIIPEGPTQDLLALIKDQLKKGMDPGRLEFVIRSARPPSNCTDPEVKRFVVSTPAHTGPKSQVSIAEGAIVIEGEGRPARNAVGNQEAWFDPGYPVKITTRYADKKTEKRDVLPFQYSVVLEDREYRFTIEKGAQSFVKVVYDSCDYP